MCRSLVFFVHRLSVVGRVVGKVDDVVFVDVERSQHLVRAKDTQTLFIDILFAGHVFRFVRGARLVIWLLLMLKSAWGIASSLATSPVSMYLEGLVLFEGRHCLCRPCLLLVPADRGRLLIPVLPLGQQGLFHLEGPEALEEREAPEDLEGLPARTALYPLEPMRPLRPGQTGSPGDFPFCGGIPIGQRIDIPHYSFAEISASGAAATVSPSVEESDSSSESDGKEGNFTFCTGLSPFLCNVSKRRLATGLRSSP